MEITRKTPGIYRTTVPGRCIGATILISRSLRSWPLQCLFPSHCGVGIYNAYFQVAAGLAVTTLIPRSATVIGATYFQVATRGLAVTLFPDPQQRLERHLFPGRCGVGGYNAYSQVRNRLERHLFPGRCRVGGYAAYSQVRK